MNKLKEWFTCYLRIAAYTWGWCVVLACMLGPLILGFCYNPWWFLSWIATIPAVYATIDMINNLGKK